jgi:hypothetical protein
MSDIVERLHSADIDILWRDALAEIEQLRADVKALSEAPYIAEEKHRYEERYAKLWEENTQLRTRLRRIWDICHIPTKGAEKAYTHFQRDFDEIRNLTIDYK